MYVFGKYASRLRIFQLMMYIVYFQPLKFDTIL